MTWEGRRAWMPDQEALDRAESIFYQDLDPPNLDRLATHLSREIESSTGASFVTRIFADALYDMASLIEEIRFGATLSASYINGLRDEIFSTDGVPDLLLATGISTEVRALLAPYMQPLPPATHLFTQPGEAIAGGRVLGGWFAAQLLDSTLVRAVAALDRVAIMLWCAAGYEFKTDRSTGEFRMPAFRAFEIGSLAAAFDRRDSWPALAVLPAHPFFGLVKPYRDVFVHRRRGFMHLHGERVGVAAGVGGQDVTMGGLDPGEHLALVLGFFVEVLCPAVNGLAALLGETPDQDAG